MAPQCAYQERLPRGRALWHARQPCRLQDPRMVERPTRWPTFLRAPLGSACSQYAARRNAPPRAAPLGRDCYAPFADLHPEGSDKMTGTTQRPESTAPTSDRLLMAIELGRRQWKVGCTTPRGQRIHRRTLTADAWDRLAEIVAVATKRLGLPTDAAVTSCDEAGRDGFWIHRDLTTLGVEHRVVDSSRLAVNRRARRAKTDAIDLATLVSLLRRQLGGEKTVWPVVYVPHDEDDVRRQPHRERWPWTRERTRVPNRITSVLATVGVSIKVHANFPTRLDPVRPWDGHARAAPLRARVAHEYETVALFTAQMKPSRARAGVNCASGAMRRWDGLNRTGFVGGPIQREDGAHGTPQ